MPDEERTLEDIALELLGKYYNLALSNVIRSGDTINEAALESEVFIYRHEIEALAGSGKEEKQEENLEEESDEWGEEDDEHFLVVHLTNGECLDFQKRAICIEKSESMIDGVRVLDGNYCVLAIIPTQRILFISCKGKLYGPEKFQ